MSAYAIFLYNVSDPEQYAKYNPGSMPVIMQTVTKHGGQVIVAGHDCIRLEGAEQDTKVIIEFPTKEAAKAWHDDPEYAAAKKIRLASTSDINAFIIDKFEMPA